MFFYLFYNSTIIGSSTDSQKNISTLIYGSIIYIIIHSILFFKHNNAFIQNLQKYFWILFTLDCVSVLFTFISKKDNLIFNSNLNFNHKKIDKQDKNRVDKTNLPKIIPKKKSNLKKNIQMKIDKIDKKVSFKDNVSDTSQGSISDYDLDEFEKSLSKISNE